jgi:hypothetical protein
LAAVAATTSGYVAVLVIDLHFPEARSLKAKRRDLQSIKAVLYGRFGAAVSETAFQDLWQRARLVAVLSSGALAVLEQSVDHLERWLDARCPAGVRVERLVGSIEDLRDVMSTAGLGG